MEFQFLKTNPFILIYPLLPQNTLKSGDSIYEKVKQNFLKNCLLKVFQDNSLKKQKTQVFQEKTKQFQNFHVCQVFQGWWPPWNKANTLSSVNHSTRTNRFPIFLLLIGLSLSTAQYWDLNSWIHFTFRAGT